MPNETLHDTADLVQIVLLWYSKPATVASIRERGLEYVRKGSTGDDQLGHACAVVDTFHSRVVAMIGPKGRVTAPRRQANADAILGQGWNKVQSELNTWPTSRVEEFAQAARKGLMIVRTEKEARRTTSPFLLSAFRLVKEKLNLYGLESRPSGEAIIATLRERHTPIPLQGIIERPDFHVTTDIRATSDPLWRHLTTFRRRLMEGGTFTPAEWQSLLIGIRMGARDAGLRPCLGHVGWIVADLAEAVRDDPAGGWDSETDAWSKVVLTAWGSAGRIELHDLVDGFADPQLREVAIEWAESWMNARERQLAGTGLVEQKDAPDSQVLPTMSDLATAAGISDDTFRRVRTAAKITVKARGAAARNWRYKPSHVDRLIRAALGGNFIERAAMAAKWERWSSK